MSDLKENAVPEPPRDDSTKTVPVMPDLPDYRRQYVRNWWVESQDNQMARRP